MNQPPQTAQPYGYSMPIQGSYQPPPSGTPFSIQGATATMAPNLDIFKQPRGFMKILQFIFAICAFATTSSFDSEIQFDVTCGDNTANIVHRYEYPFQLYYGSETATVCVDTEDVVFGFIGDFSSDSRFFVATGVLAMLYTVCAVILYGLFDQAYQEKREVPLADFIIHVIASVFWLSASAAWANGLGGLKSLTNPQDLFTMYEICKQDGVDCVSISGGNYASLNISVILGFLNFFLWAANLWFLYKETEWFKGPQTTEKAPNTDGEV